MIGGSLARRTRFGLSIPLLIAGRKLIVNYIDHALFISGVLVASGTPEQPELALRLFCIRHYLY
jgi:hypothetical protein